MAGVAVAVIMKVHYQFADIDVLPSCFFFPFSSLKTTKFSMINTVTCNFHKSPHNQLRIHLRVPQYLNQRPN